MEHTPGPWKTMQPVPGSNHVDVVNEAGETIAMPFRSRRMERAEYLANAELISRAPTLHASLNEAREALKAMLLDLRDLRADLPLKDTSVNHARILAIGQRARNLLDANAREGKT